MSERIRFGEPVELATPLEKLPPEDLIQKNNRITSQKPFLVYIVNSAYQKIFEHTRTRLDVECGGVLVGYPFKSIDTNQIFVVVVGAIPQNSHNRSAVHFTVGPEEIDEARIEQEMNFPGLIVVGWYHSHPGLGVFLSNQDMTIVRSIYNASWNIALVVDPKGRKDGLFLGAEGEEIEVSDWRQNGHPCGILLSEIPDCIKAIALYNQALSFYKEKHYEKSRDLLDELKNLVEKSDQLGHWKNGYRDISAQYDDFEELSVINQNIHDTQIPEFVENQSKESGPPQPHRKGHVAKYSWWTRISLIAFLLYGLIIILPFVKSLGKFSSQLLLSAQILSAGLIIIVAGNIWMSKNNKEQPAYPASERMIAMIILLIGILSILISISFFIYTTLIMGL